VFGNPTQSSLLSDFEKLPTQYLALFPHPINILTVLSATFQTENISSDEMLTTDSYLEKLLSTIFGIKISLN